MASKATKKARIHLRNACEDELETFVNKRDIFFTEWSNIVSEIERLANDYDFKALTELANIISKVGNSADGSIMENYNTLSDHLEDLRLILEYEDFKHLD